MPRVTKTGPPGSANAFTEASSTTWNCQGRLGRVVCLARPCPRLFTYASTFGSLYVPIVCWTSWAACLPISISWLSETMSSCNFPVAGLRTQPKRMADAAAARTALVMEPPSDERLPHTKNGFRAQSGTARPSRWLAASVRIRLFGPEPLQCARDDKPPCQVRRRRRHPLRLRQRAARPQDAGARRGTRCDAEAADRPVHAGRRRGRRGATSLAASARREAPALLDRDGDRSEEDAVPGLRGHLRRAPASALGDLVARPQPACLGRLRLGDLRHLRAGQSGRTRAPVAFPARGARPGD